MYYVMPLAEQGVKESRLFTRVWDRVFVVDVEWKDNNRSFFSSGNDLEPDQFQGRIACEWNEYVSEFELILSILSGSVICNRNTYISLRILNCCGLVKVKMACHLRSNLGSM